MIDSVFSWVVEHWFVTPVVLVALLFLLSGFRLIPNNKVGIVEKRLSGSGSVKHGLMALRGEAGFQPDVLRGGLHFLWPLQYRVHTMPLVTIPQGKIGYVFARDGAPLPPAQALATNVTATDFQDVRGFLAAGGQKGPQRKILREGTYAVNLAEFVVITNERVYYLPLEKGEDQVFHRMSQLIEARYGFVPVVIQGTDDAIGVVTVHDGPSMQPGQIIAPTLGDDANQPDTYHNSFQDPEKFLAAGGQRGRQLQTLVEGTYYINRLFATVEAIPKTVVEVGTVGVVVSYTGDAGVDISGEAYKHGELVKKGTRGVWIEPLLPGKYAFNTYAGKVIMVPTTNFILKWNRTETGSHKFDENLAEVSLITKDAFEPSLPLSVVVHIDYRKAPLVIQRFGDIKRLVEQTLDPMVSAYFKNVGQTRTLIQLLQDRSAIQQVAGEQMKEKFSQYNLELQEVLIGTPTGQGGQIEQILTQLRSRQIAEEQVETYTRQEKAAVKERELREAESRAKQQANITESEISISVQTNQGKADLARAQQQATQIQALAQAEAEKMRILGEGEAKKIQALANAQAEQTARVGVAQALAIEEQVRAYGGPRFQLTQEVMNRFAQAIEASRVDVVPKIVIGGQGGGNGASGGGMSGNVMEALLAMLLSDKIGAELGPHGGSSPRHPDAERLRNELTRQMGGASGA
ncbi:MAG TPA: SPFH domain-containing protein [Polyangiaceae bacterium]|nr:SPFH domain-containing protein [Polyangiaceae bacterium]